MRLVDDLLEETYGTGRFQKLLCLFQNVLAFTNSFEFKMTALMSHGPQVICSNNSSVPVIARNASINGSTAQLYGLHCEHRHINYYLSMCFMLFCALSYVSNFASEYLGRRRVILAMLAVDFASQLTAALPLNLTLMFIVRAVRGSVMSVRHVYLGMLLEATPIRKRAVFGNLGLVGWFVSHLAIGLVGFFVKDLQTIRYIFLAALLPYPVIAWMTIEPPRWLAVRGHADASLDAFKQIAKINGVKFSVSTPETPSSGVTCKYHISNHAAFPRPTCPQNIFLAVYLMELASLH